MLRVYYSNRTEELLGALVERMGEHRSSFYEPVHVVVPNRNMETYLKLELARVTGICANLTFRLPQDLLETRSEGRSRRVALHDRVLTGLFDDASLDGPELEPVKSYLRAGGEDRDSIDLRRVQLARELSRLFGEYARSRPELLECWRAGLYMGGDEFREIEAWQRRFWLDVVAEEPGGEEVAAADAPTALHVFGVSYMTRAQIDELGHLAQSSSVYVYTVNPCQEIWEAQSTPMPPSQEKRRYERRSNDLGPGEVFSLDDPFRLVNPGEMLPLRLWARPGRENLRLLNALTGCELVPRIREPDGKTLLHQFQRDIALRKPDRTAVPQDFHFEDDESIVVLECGNVRRELEAIAAEIWRLTTMTEHEDLRFNDIAVILVPSSAERYQALIGSVFGEMHGLPHNVVDLPVRSESRLAEAVELLLDIPTGRFSRQDVLRFVTHPTVLASFPDASRDDWLAWCDALGIVHGADRRDHEGTYIRKDVFNWDQGLKRLALGAFMSDERSGDDRLFEQGEDTYLPEEISHGQMACAGGFGLLVRSLVADAREAGRVQMTVPAWMDFMSAFIASYVEPSSPEDGRVLRKCLHEVSALSAMTLGGAKARYGVARELVRSALAGLSGSRGQYLVDGVVVSSFLPMRSIPFKVVFIAGLGEGHFPAQDGKNHLDLRHAQRRAGDVSVREQDKYLFLETLLCAREKLYLSYVARDELTGETLQPSALVLELEETLGRGFVKELPRRRYPLHRCDDGDTQRASPPAAREKSARELGESLKSHLGRLRLPRASDLDFPTTVRDVLGCITPPARNVERDEVPSITLSAIRQFLECPLQGSASFALRLRDDDDLDLLEHEDEVFGATPLDRALLLREAYRRGGDAAAYDEVAHRFELRGDRPTGAFGVSERQQHLAVLESWRNALREATDGADELRLHTREPHVFALETTRVELGRSPLFYLESPRMALRLCSQRRSRFHPRRESLKAFLDHVFHSAAGLVLDEPYKFVAVNAPPKEDARWERFTFQSISREKARRYLAAVIEDMRQGVHDYFLPCEVVFAGIGQIPIGRTSTNFGPVPHPEDYASPDDARAREIVERRFGLYYESLGESP